MPQCRKWVCSQLGDYCKVNLCGINLCASGSYSHYWKGEVENKKIKTHWSDTRKIFSLRWANCQLLLWAYLEQNKELHFQLSNYFCILMYCFWQQDVENKNAVVSKITFMRWWSQKNSGWLCYKSFISHFADGIKDSIDQQQRLISNKIFLKTYFVMCNLNLFYGIF